MRFAPKRRRSRLAKTSLAVFAGFLLLWVLENWLGERTTFSASLLYLPQHGWGLFALLLLVVALGKKRFKLALFNAAALGFWLSFLMGAHVSFARHTPSATVRVLTWNVARGRFALDQLEIQIRAQNPDIVCLQETQGFEGQKISYFPGDELKRRFVGWNYEIGGDAMTLSRFPLLSSRVLPLQGTRKILETTWQTPRGPLRVFNVHIATSLSGRAPFKSPTRNLFKKIGDALITPRSDAQILLNQFPALETARTGSGANLPSVLAGDFNTPPRGIFYRRLRQNWGDAFADKGNGLGLTFNAPFPLLRIDYVFLSPNVRATRAFVGEKGASDHRLVVADVTF